MATKRKFDAVTPRPKYGQEGEVWWHKVGKAVENEKGNIIVYLDSVPVPDPKKENQVVIMLFEQRDEDKSSRDEGVRKTTARGASTPRGGVEDDEIPF